MIKEIITDIDELSGRSEEIDIRTEAKLMRETIIIMKDAIREKNLKGLSAPQIGVPKRIIVLNFNGDMRSFINPIITEQEGFDLVRETCSSIPGKSFIRPRSTTVTAMYQTPLGKIESRKFIGLAATVFQHELDHLDGLPLSEIGLEVTEEFDEASEDEKAELIKVYLESLDLKEQEVKKEIEQDETLKKTMDAIDFLEKVQKGEVKLGDGAIEKLDNIKDSEDNT